MLSESQRKFEYYHTNILEMDSNEKLYYVLYISRVRRCVFQMWASRSSQNGCKSYRNSNFMYIFINIKYKDVIQNILLNLFNNGLGFSFVAMPMLYG